MKRRAFIGGLAGAAAWPLSARAQGERVRRIGVLTNGIAGLSQTQSLLDTFVESLGKLGWVEGRNVHIEVRWGGEDGSGFAPGATALMKFRPDVIFAATTPATTQVHKLTRDIPIVFAVVNDPVGQGFVATFPHPGGNMTGFIAYDAPIAGKWLELLKEITPGVSRAALLFDPDTAPYARTLRQTLEAAASSTPVKIESAPVRSDDEIERTVAALGRQAGSSLIVAPDGFTGTHRAQIIAAAALNHVPAIYPYRQFAEAGGLMSYGFVLPDLFRRAASYVDRILRGAKPSDLPVQAPVQFELFINLKTAKALGLTVPDTLLHIADEVIE